MAAADLSSLIVSNISAIPGITISNPGELEKFATAIATAVDTYLKTKVMVVGTVGSGPGSGGSVTGTLTT